MPHNSNFSSAEEGWTLKLLVLFIYTYIYVYKAELYINNTFFLLFLTIIRDGEYIMLDMINLTIDASIFYLYFEHHGKNLNRSFPIF